MKREPKIGSNQRLTPIMAIKIAWLKSNICRRSDSSRPIRSEENCRVVTELVTLLESDQARLQRLRF